MPLSEREKSYYYKKIVALRKGLQTLEEELGLESPALPKRRRNSFREHLETTVALGTWRKPDDLKKRKKNHA